MSDFNVTVKASVDRHGTTAVANCCKTSLLAVRRWTEGFLPHEVAQASVLKAIGDLASDDDDVCGVEWDDRDDPTIERGGGYSCELAYGHDGQHQYGADGRWTK